MENISLLKKLCLSNGISGDENSIREIIIYEIKDHCDSIMVDNLGNIIVYKKGKNKSKLKLMLSAHMDEVGFVVTSITNDGYIKFSAVGGIDRRVVLGKSVSIGFENVFGVIGVKPIHLTSGDEVSRIPNFDDMYIDIGAKSKEDAQKYVSLGDSICFCSTFEHKNSMIKSKALDDRAGCFLLIQMIKSELPYDMHFTFVVQEEVGLRGAKVATYTVEPDFALVLESTTAADIPDVAKQKQVCNVGYGTVVSFMDRSTIYDKQMYNMAFECAKELNSKIQTKRAVAGGNDSGVIHSSKSGVRTLALSLPCRYLHSSISMISEEDLNGMYEITCLLAKKICGEKI